MVLAEIGSQNSSSEREKLWLWLIILGGAALRFYRLDAQSLWQDEGLQYFVASADSVGAVLDRTRWRTWHPPLAYVINHFFLLAGNTDFFLRLPSALFGIGSLPIFYVLTKRLASEHTAMVALAVMAISPFHIWYSQEGRMYAQLVFFSLLSALIFIRALENRQWHWWVLYSLIVAIGMYTHVLMAFMVLAEVFWLLFYHRRRLMPLIASGALVALLFLPWVYSFPMVQNFIHSNSNRGPRIVADSTSSGFSWAVLPYTFFTFSTGFSLGPSVAELHENRSFAFILEFLPLLLVIGITMGTLLIVGIWALYKLHGAKCLVFCLLGLVVPLGGAVFFSLLPQGLFNVRYAIVAFPFFCAFVGGGLVLAFLKNKFIGSIAVAGIASICAASLINHFSNPRYAKEDVKSAVTSWRSITGSDVLLSVAPGGVRDAINRYLAEAERNRHIAMGMQNPVSKTRDFFAKNDVSFAYVLLARDWHRASEKALRSTFSVVDEHAYPGVKLLKVRKE